MVNKNGGNQLYLYLYVEFYEDNKTIMLLSTTLIL